ncbi:MAG: MMPL family transporter [Flavobacteriales bacterium]|nr:MMPL family transporter [Flavobacteriales bacterium]
MRNRIALLVVVVLVTVFMAFQARTVTMSYKFGGILPKDDSTQIEYDRFTQRFSEDGNILVLGVAGEELHTYPTFSKWYTLGYTLKAVDGIDSVFSEAHLYTLIKNPEKEKFEVSKVVQRRPQSTEEVDSLTKQIRSLPFYKNLLYNDSTNASLMMLFVNRAAFNSEKRVQVLEQVEEIVEAFSDDTGLAVHYSGLPYIRTRQTAKIKQELGMFVGLAAAVTALLMFLFFKSFRVMFVSLLVVIIGVIWSIGTIGILGFKLSALMGLIPPLIIVIGVPNCVFLLNKYHNEYRLHGNQIKALSRVIHKVGNATFMTNATTAMGFATFIFTQSAMLKEFGVVASMNILSVFVLSLIIIPCVFSFIAPPRERHVAHLDRKWVDKVVALLHRMVSNHRRLVYVGTITLLLVSIYGASLMKATGNIVDDLPKDDRIITDLRFFEENFAGVMPLEILVNTLDSSQVTKTKTLRKIEKIQRILEAYPEISRSLAITDALKFAKQAYYNGLEDRYSLITSYEKSFLAPYLRGKGSEEAGKISQLFLDSTQTVTRISAQIADIGTTELDSLMQNLKPKVFEIFPKDQYKVTLTGTSIVFLNGTDYLVRNLFISLAIAIFVISILMALLFNSARMVVISLFPNLLPLLFTAGLMGYFGVAIKPSTILVFSIAFGISVDDTIHFLSKYRQELKTRSWDIRTCVLNAVTETGVSMIYTSIILFFGFLVFTASNFGGTVALGTLVSVTLLVAMISNLVLLPSLLLSFHKSLVTKSFREPLLEIINEEEDIELEELEIRKP